MAASGVAKPANSLRVDFEFRGMRAHPTHRRLAIVNLSWEFRLRCQPIADRHGHVAVLGEWGRTARQLRSGTHPPSAAMNDKHAGIWTGTGRHVNIGIQRP